MDQLTPVQKTAVGKSSSDRLRLHHLKAGCQEEEEGLAWSRQELMQRYAEVLVRGDPEPEAVVKTVDQEYKMARFEHEERMKKMDRKLRLAEMDAEKERLAAKKERYEANERLEKEK